MALDLNQNSQIRILNTLLQEETGEKYIKYFSVLDETVLKRTFSFIGSALLLELILEFYQTYHHIPSYDDFNQFCLDSKKYTEFTTHTHPTEMEKFRAFEVKLFEEVKETKYLLDTIRDFIIECFSSYIMMEKLEALKQAATNKKVGSSFEIHKEFSEKETQFIMNLEADLSNAARVQFVDVMREDVDVTTLDDSTSVHIFGTLHMYLHNIAVVMSPAKFWKTGFTILTGVRTCELSYETAFLDLENGYNRILRRLYQNLTKVTKNEVKFNIILNREVLHNEHGLLLHNSHLKDYEEGQVTYSLAAIKGQDGKEYPSLIFKQCDGLSADGQQLLWTDLEEYKGILLEEVSAPYQPVLDKVKKEFREKGGGGFHLAHSKGVKPNDIRRALVNLEVDNEHWKRAGKENKRVLIIDWMLLLDSDNPIDSVWLKSNNIYAALQKMAAEFNLYIIAIEGVANPEDLKKWDVDLAAINPKFNKGIDYNAAHVSVLAASELEKPIVRRMYAKEDRDGSSGTKDDCSYFIISPQLMQAKEITREEHQEMFPTLWGLNADGDEGSAESVVMGNDDFVPPAVPTLDIPKAF